MSEEKEILKGAQPEILEEIDPKELDIDPDVMGQFEGGVDVSELKGEENEEV